MKSNIRELILGIVVVVLLLVFFIKQTSGFFVECKDKFVEKNAASTKLAESKVRAEELALEAKRVEEQQNALKPFFKLESGSQNDSISAFGGMFEDFIDYIKIEGLMLRSIEYNINPQTDPIYKSFSSQYNVCEVKLFLVGTYSQLNTLLKDIDNYPYFVSVSQLSVAPYQANKRYLLINISIMLYSKK